MPPRKASRASFVVWAVLVAALAIGSWSTPAGEPPAADASFAPNLLAWRQDRLERLTSEDGWLTLAGLFWLEEGANTCGSDPSSNLVFPGRSVPPKIGVFYRRGEEVELEPAPGVAVTAAGEPIAGRLRLDSDATGVPTRLQLGSLDFHLIRRGDRFGVRLKDSQSPLRLHFPGLDYFPADVSWRVAARFEPHVPPKRVSVPNVLGTVNEEESPGAVVFERGGVSYRLDALPGSEGELFLVFGDATSGKESYGGGRFLYADPPDADGKVLLDFNRAYNPPCAFTAFATCPLPPPENKLKLAIEAGEKKFAGGHH
ncbi:MAG: DUF1684 domain-containing protein [Thermoanaerobaculia bacterium]|nr:DUF1684 domain-containing protein [Thermoanaerobaculia bacterium]